MKPRFQPFPGHGMTAQEAAVMQRFDDGESPAEIAIAEGAHPSRVKSIVESLREGRPDRWEAAARRGSIELLAAIRRLGASHAA